MIFNSIQYMIFFPIVTLIYFIFKPKVRWIWLLISSYYFYMCWNAKYALLIGLSTVVTYISGVLISKVNDSNKLTNKKKYKISIVTLSLIINLGILFFFKYYNFFTGLGIRVLSKINISMNFPVFDVILPVGISFYTFQALSYTIDVYRGDIKAEKNIF